MASRHSRLRRQKRRDDARTVEPAAAPAAAPAAEDAATPASAPAAAPTDFWRNEEVPADPEKFIGCPVKASDGYRAVVITSVLGWSYPGHHEATLGHICSEGAAEPKAEGAEPVFGLETPEGYPIERFWRDFTVTGGPPKEEDSGAAEPTKREPEAEPRERRRPSPLFTGSIPNMLPKDGE